MWLLKYVSRQKVTNSILESPPCSNHLAFAPFNKALWKHGIIHLGLVGKKQYRITPAVVNQCHLITVLSSLTTINIGCWSTSIGCGCRWGTVGITFSAIRVHTIHEVHRSKAIKRKKPHSNIRSGSLSTWSSSIISFPTMRKHCRCMASWEWRPPSPTCVHQREDVTNLSRDREPLRYWDSTLMSNNAIHPSKKENRDNCNSTIGGVEFCNLLSIVQPIKLSCC